MPMRKKEYIAVVAVVIAAAIVLAFVYFYSQPQHPVGITQPVQLSNSINSFLASFGPSNPFPLLNVTTNPNANVNMVNSSCVALLTTAYYLGRNFSITHPVDFATLSTTEPFFEYTSIKVYNSTIAQQAASRFYSNRGFCDTKIFSLIISNSTYSSTPTTVDGNPAYILRFSNLTPAGIRYAIANYTGSTPSNVDYYMVVSMYKGVDVEVGDEGFSQTMNVSRLILLEGKILQKVEGLVG